MIPAGRSARALAASNLLLTLGSGMPPHCVPAGTAPQLGLAEAAGPALLIRLCIEGGGPEPRQDDNAAPVRTQ